MSPTPHRQAAPKVSHRSKRQTEEEALVLHQPPLLPYQLVATPPCLETCYPWGQNLPGQLLLGTSRLSQSHSQMTPNLAPRGSSLSPRPGARLSTQPPWSWAGLQKPRRHCVEAEPVTVETRVSILGALWKPLHLPFWQPECGAGPLKPISVWL